MAKRKEKRQVYLEKIGDCVLFLLALTKYRLTFARPSRASLNESPTLNAHIVDSSIEGKQETDDF